VAALAFAVIRNFPTNPVFEFCEHKRGNAAQEDAMKSKLALAALALAVVTGASGLAMAQDGRYNDRDDNRYYDRDDSSRYGLKVARDVGFNDGAQVAREDNWNRKPFNPNPRGPYDNADHGYRSQFGDRHEYREAYSAAYRNGYFSVRGRGYYR
jgi:hypothetical protein